MSHSPGPAFVIGISGHMDIPVEDEPEIRQRLRLVFDWLRQDPDSLPEPVPDWWPRIANSEHDGSENRLLTGLGLKDQRIILLSSMAPGADTIAAELALELGIEVRGALPFPGELYRSASTYTADNVHHSARETFDAFLSDSESDHFPILLNEDLALSNEELQERFREDIEDPERRHLRYRASGEFVAAYSQLFIALYQPSATEELSETAAGTEAIVRACLEGPGSGLIPAADHFPWIDSSPVFHLHTRSLKRLDSPDEVSDLSWKSIPARFLGPFTVDDEADDSPACQAVKGYQDLRETARLMNGYREAGSRLESTPDAEASLDTLIGVSHLKASGLSEEGSGFLRKLAPMAATHVEATAVADKGQKARTRMMKAMALFAFIAALAFHGFSHWHFAHKELSAATHPTESETALHLPSEDESHDGSIARLEGIEATFSTGFLLLSVAIVLVAALAFLSYCRRNDEWLRFDARALAEGLRIQFFWAASGISGSVSSRYMNRQKGQLDWIRNGVRSLSFPYDRWRREFQGLSANDKHLILKSVISCWLEPQRRFFTTALPKSQTMLHRFHILGWGLTISALIQIVLILVWKLTHADISRLLFPIWSFCLLAGTIVYLLRFSPSSRYGRKHPHLFRDPNLLYHGFDLLSRAGRVPIILLSIGLSTLAVSYLPHLAWWTPDTKALWVILIGSTLISGAILVAWSEKLSLAEHTRQYAAMANLYSQAGPRAEKLLQDWAEAEFQNSVDANEALERLNGLLIELGKEALDENAEWLLLHRSRPFEPFLAG